MKYVKRKVDTESAKLYWEAEVRSVTGRKISGVIYYNKLSVDMGGWREKIAPGAFTIESPAYLLWSHDSSKPLASTGNGSLELKDTPTGLRFSANIPSTQAGNDGAHGSIGRFPIPGRRMLSAPIADRHSTPIASASTVPGGHDLARAPSRATGAADCEA